jgi:hypothetical protein
MPFPGLSIGAARGNTFKFIALAHRNYRKASRRQTKYNVYNGNTRPLTQAKIKWPETKRKEYKNE